jgi:hypothetical protein
MSILRVGEADKLCHPDHMQDPTGYCVVRLRAGFGVQAWQAGAYNPYCVFLQVLGRCLRVANFGEFLFHALRE